MDNNRKINQICKPHFLGIGAARTGTTWLSHCLSKHSQVYIPPINNTAYEVHYFDRYQSTTASFLRMCFRTLPRLMKETIKGTRPEPLRHTFYALWWCFPPQSALFVLFHLLNFPYLHYRLLNRSNINLRWWTKFFLGRLKRNPEEWYASLFEPTGQQICGEITPTYGLLPEGSVEYMQSFNKDMRFIYLVRNPIERDWSHISIQTAKVSLSLCDVQKYLWVEKFSDFLGTLRRYLKYVAPENLFLGFYEDILFHRNRFLTAVQAFLGLPAEEISSKPQHSSRNKGIKLEYAVYFSQRNLRKIEEMASVFGGYAQFWLDVASELYHTDTTIHSNETFLSTPFATNDLWRSRWEYSGAKDFQSGPLSTLPFVNKLIR